MLARQRPRYDQEFLAAPAGHVVAGAHQFAEQRAELLQHTVAAAVAVAVVDALEVIDVDQQEQQDVVGPGSCRFALRR